MDVLFRHILRDFIYKFVLGTSYLGYASFHCGRRRLQVNLLKPTGYGMHQQFYIQQLYALPIQ
jgi:hypothetical protein